MTEMLCNMPV